MLLHATPLRKNYDWSIRYRSPTNWRPSNSKVLMSFKIYIYQRNTLCNFSLNPHLIAEQDLMVSNYCNDDTADNRVFERDPWDLLVLSVVGSEPVEYRIHMDADLVWDTRSKDSRAIMDDDSVTTRSSLVVEHQNLPWRAAQTLRWLLPLSKFRGWVSGQDQRGVTVLLWLSIVPQTRRARAFLYLIRIAFQQTIR